MYAVGPPGVYAVNPETMRATQLSDEVVHDFGPTAGETGIWYQDVESKDIVYQPYVDVESGIREEARRYTLHAGIEVNGTALLKSVFDMLYVRLSPSPDLFILDPSTGAWAVEASPLLDFEYGNVVDLAVNSEGDIGFCS